MSYKIIKATSEKRTIPYSRPHETNDHNDEYYFYLAQINDWGSIWCGYDANISYASLSCILNHSSNCMCDFVEKQNVISETLGNIREQKNLHKKTMMRGV